MNELQPLWMKNQMVGRVYERNEGTKKMMKMTQLKSMGAYKKQKSLEDSTDIPSTVGVVNQPR